MNSFQKINVCALLTLSMLSATAQTTYMEMEQLTVNDQVTTVITASEPIRFVDISTDKVVGDQPINNTIRLKPKDNVYADGEVLAIVTIVTGPTNEARAEPSALELCLARRRKTRSTLPHAVCLALHHEDAGGCDRQGDRVL